MHVHIILHTIPHNFEFPPLLLLWLGTPPPPRWVWCTSRRAEPKKRMREFQKYLCSSLGVFSRCGVELGLAVDNIYYQYILVSHVSPRWYHLMCPPSFILYSTSMSTDNIFSTFSRFFFFEEEKIFYIFYCRHDTKLH